MATPENNIATYVADYGVGVDCHSRFIQVWVLAKLGDTISHWDRRYSTTWEDLCEARDWVISTLFQAIAERAPTATTLTYCIESTAAYHYPVLLQAAVGRNGGRIAGERAKAEANSRKTLPHEVSQSISSEAVGGNTGQRRSELGPPASRAPFRPVRHARSTMGRRGRR